MCWIIPLIVGLLSALLGYLIARRMCDGHEDEIKRLKQENEFLLKENKSLIKRAGSCETELESIKSTQVKDAGVMSHVAGISMGAVAGATVASVAGSKETVEDVEPVVAHVTDSEPVVALETPEVSDVTESKSVVDKVSDIQEDSQGLKASLTAAMVGGAAATTVAQSTDTDGVKQVKSDVDHGRGPSFAGGFVNQGDIVPVVNAEVAYQVFGRTISQDDLTLIEGVGPRAVEFFGEEGITTWKQISEMTPEACKAILEKAGGRFAQQDPSTWPEQAKLAVQGEWQKLFDWQEELDAGEVVSE